tara:strand:- start:57315 stop:57896 length:582 start_codon:yes stop_codon:yes gene_type:complete
VNRLILISFISILSANSLTVLDHQISSHIEGTNDHIILDFSMETFSLLTPVIEWSWIYHSWVYDKSSMKYQMGILGMITTYSLVGMTKYAFKRKRPKRNYKPRLWNTRLTPSFPSGHVASSALWATIFSPNQKIGPLSYIALSAWSQVYVGNHYFSDVFTGAIVGSIIGKIIRTKYSKNFHNPSTSLIFQITF